MSKLMASVCSKGIGKENVEILKPSRGKGISPVISRKFLNLF